jgi:hypothetical protein
LVFFWYNFDKNKPEKEISNNFVDENQDSTDKSPYSILNTVGIRIEVTGKGNLNTP